MTGPERRHATRNLEGGAGGDVPVAAEPGHLSRRAWLARVAGLGLGVASARSLEAARPAGALVGVARGATMAAATRAAVRLAGGLDFIQPGQTVLVKPNLCCPRPQPGGPRLGGRAELTKTMFSRGAPRAGSARVPRSRRRGY